MRLQSKSYAYCASYLEKHISIPLLTASLEDVSSQSSYAEAIHSVPIDFE